MTTPLEDQLAAALLAVLTKQWIPGQAEEALQAYEYAKETEAGQLPVGPYFSEEMINRRKRYFSRKSYDTDKGIHRDGDFIVTEEGTFVFREGEWFKVTNVMDYPRTVPNNNAHLEEE